MIKFEPPLNKKQRETFFVYNWNARNEVSAKQNEREAAGWLAGQRGVTAS